MRVKYKHSCDRCNTSDYVEFKYERVSATIEVVGVAIFIKDRWFNEAESISKLYVYNYGKEIHCPFCGKLFIFNGKEFIKK